jgi:uncharacterized protein YkwD
MILAHLPLPPAPSYIPLASASPVALMQAVAQVTVPASEDIIAELNKARSNPGAYADWLETLRPYYRENVLGLPGEDRIRTQSGTLDSAIAFLRQLQPLPPLTISPGMSRGAQDHVNDLGSIGAIGSTGSDNSSAGDRVNRYGNWGTSITELTSYGKRTASAAVVFLVLNDRLRAEMFNPAFQVLGVACGTHANQETMCVLDYAATYVEQETSATPSVVSAQFPMLMAAIATTHYFSQLQADYLSPIEREILAETNRLRHDPKQYAAELENLKQYYDGLLLKLPGFPALETVEGVAAVDEAIAALRSTRSLSQLTPSEGMSLGARDHVKDMGDRGSTGHYGSDGSDPFARISRYGNWQLVPGKSVAGENISFSPIHLAHWHILQWLIDDGVATRGHREALLRPEYQRAGVACGTHSVYENMCVMEYASDYEEAR